MSDIIHLLPDSIANQIAAGEVIQRPASVIKELVENALDAHATHVRIELSEAGRDLIRVIDNGIGMSATDARMAFERHATSKISKVEDLFSLHTKGFRGEALASIAAVSQVELITRPEDEELGIKLCISGSELVASEPCTAPVGSIFSIKNLFYNIPARRKFLKSNDTELRNILQEIERIVLVHPEISFEVQHNGQQIYNLEKSSTKLRIIDTLGKKYDKDLISIVLDGPIFKIEGFVGRPEGARKRGAKQFFFVNNRFMRHAFFHKAVLSAYEGIVRPGEQPNYFIYLTVDPASIDVNIHPAKTEIKFEDEQSIFRFLHNLTREGLASAHAIPTIDFEAQHTISIPPYRGVEKGDLTLPAVDLDPSYNPFDVPATRGTTTKNSPDLSEESNIPWADLFKQIRGKHHPSESYSPEQPKDSTKQSHPMYDMPFPAGRYTSITCMSQANAASELFDPPTSSSPSLRPFYLYGDRYLITTRPEGLALVDYHRAHERVLYDHFLEQCRRGKIEQQQLLFPDTLSFPTSDHAKLPPILEQLRKVGFDLSPCGENYSLTAAPLIIATDAGDIVTEIIQAYLDGVLCSAEEEVYKAIAHKIASLRAWPYGRQLCEEEALKLLSDLFALPDATYTAGGKLIVSIIEEAEIQSRFGR